MQTRERAHCARSVFPFIKKKKKKILSEQSSVILSFSFFIPLLYSVTPLGSNYLVGKVLSIGI